MKRGVVGLILIGIGALLLRGPAAVWSDGASKNNIRFLWAFGAIVQTADGPEVMAIKRNTILPGPAQLKLLVQLHEMAYIYVIHRDASGAIRMLFPYRLDLFVLDYQISKAYHITLDAPGGRALAPGRQTIYLLASTERLANLEDALSAYLAAPAPRQSELAKGVIDEIHQAKRRYGTLVAKEERPIEIAGQRRSLALNLSAVAIDIAAQDFYSRTFTVEYR
jgi:hypothetical protein